MDELDTREWRRLGDDLTAGAACGRTRAAAASMLRLKPAHRAA
jgi:hypothetical protein